MLAGVPHLPNDEVWKRRGGAIAATNLAGRRRQPRRYPGADFWTQNAGIVWPVHISLSASACAWWAATSRFGWSSAASHSGEHCFLFRLTPVSSRFPAGVFSTRFCVNCKRAFKRGASSRLLFPCHTISRVLRPPRRQAVGRHPPQVGIRQILRDILGGSVGDATRTTEPVWPCGRRRYGSVRRSVRSRPEGRSEPPQ